MPIRRQLGQLALSVVLWISPLFAGGYAHSFSGEPFSSVTAQDLGIKITRPEYPPVSG